MTCYHRVGAIGTVFTVRIRTTSPSGATEDVSLERATAYEIELRRPDGIMLRRPGTKAADSNDISWTDTEGILTLAGTWLLSANVLFGDGTYLKASGNEAVEVVP